MWTWIKISCGDEEETGNIVSMHEKLVKDFEMLNNK